jgi:hypothetical protein
MDFSMHGKHLLIALISLAGALLAVGCGSNNMASNPVNPSVTGPSFVVGTDAPMASVTSFTVPVQNICGVTTDSTTGLSQCVPLLSGTPTVDFARFNGLQTLLDMNNVQAGTYTQLQITLGAATIGYLNVPANGAATLATEAASYSSPCSSATSCTYTATLANPLVVTQTGAPVGVRVDFDLAKSIAVDGSGNITGVVTPTFNVSTVGIDDTGGYIDTMVAGVVSVGTQSFVVQGPHGEQFTINVSGTTEWENNESISSLTASSIVEVTGKLDMADQTMDADDVAILAQNGFYASGQITYVTPATGAANSFDLYVRGLLPADTGLELGQIATVDLNGNENYFIDRMRDQFLASFLFNSSQLLPGQDVSIGGPATGAANAGAVTVKRVVLRHWGFDGTVVADIANQPPGTFQMQINGFAGVLVPQTVTVYAVGPSATMWRFGYGSMGNVNVGDKVRVVGLLLKAPVSGNTVLLAHYVDGPGFMN